MIRRLSFLLILSLVLLFSGCTFQEEETGLSSAEESFPDIRLTHGSYQIAQSGNDMMYVRADLIEITEEEHLAFFVNASFDQKESDGSHLFEGTCGELKIDTDTDTVHLSSGYTVSVNEGEFFLKGDELLYESEKRLLSSDSGKQTVLTNEKGDILSGIGFSGDLKTKLFEFDVLEEGHITYGE